MYFKSKCIGITDSRVAISSIEMRKMELELSSRRRRTVRRRMRCDVGSRMGNYITNCITNVDFKALFQGGTVVSWQGSRWAKQIVAAVCAAFVSWQKEFGAASSGKARWL